MTPVADVVVTDAVLVLAAQDGDRDAFRQLFDRHVHRVAGVCRQRLRCASDVDDAVQEAFVRALTKIGQLDDPDRFGAWIRSIAVRVCLDHHRAARRVIPVLDGDEDADVRDEGPLPDELFEVQERGAAARGHLRQIGDRDRRALWLRHVDEAPISAVALELGLTEGSTRVMLARARERLRAVTTTLPALLPLSWRTWLRDHMPAVTPGIEAVVVAVTVGVMAIIVPGADAREPARSEPAVATPAAERQGSDGPARRAAHEGDTKAPTGVRGSADRMTKVRSASSSGPAPAAPARTSTIGDVADSVDVDDEYPDQGESDEMVDVTVFATGEEGREEGSVRVYAKQLGPTGTAAYDTAADLLPGPGNPEGAPPADR